MKIKSFKEALELSIEMWQGIVDGEPYTGCFLCEWDDDQGWMCTDCFTHGIWGKNTHCLDPKSPYRKWDDYPTAENATKVRDALKRALKRLEKNDNKRSNRKKC